MASTYIHLKIYLTQLSDHYVTLTNLSNSVITLTHKVNLQKSCNYLYLYAHKIYKLTWIIFM